MAEIFVLYSCHYPLGIGTIGLSFVGGAMATGAGFKGAYDNISEGRKEMKQAALRERETGVPKEVRKGKQRKCKRERFAH